ncbi:spermidine/putrescine ABC transporter substrate-binding protein [Aquaspirillum sp. LM1]|jgi:putative spermidine/putrescine transport system substrate-binding protein|uniref:ABC transporter substrate-binding protein n=1 Tax=Aquaspirillum sp. LM1 TaxID=1938604 RepID=UPI00098399CA|nr:ABC transporter substrate-binding protein [Aquaspirillum sp. LM1]AQR64927.1 spermidine/putrescine ABC transporter substrate-binding protein [Aquaspirillum sp. LM1]
MKKMIQLAAVAAVATAFAGQAMARDLAVVSFGGANKEAQVAAFYQPFEKATGQKVVGVDYNGEVAKVKAMVETGKVTWDVVEVESPEVLRGCDEGIYEKIDPKLIGGKAAFLPGTVSECGVGIFVWSTAIAYNADKLKAAPTGWADFWDVKKYPGKRGLRKGAKYTLEFALLADGVKPADVYKVLGTKAGVERAFKKLDQLKPSIQWWEAGAQPPQFLASGDVVMSSAYNGRIDAAQKEGKNLKIVWNGSIWDIDSWVIPKGSPNKDLALKFVQFASKPESQKNYSHKIAYGPTNKAATGMIDPKVLPTLPTAPANLSGALGINVQFWVDHGEELEERFNAWASK